MYGQSSSDANMIMLMQTIGAPLIVALAGLLLWWLLRRRVSPPLLIMAPAVALGFWISYGWIQGRTGLPPRQAMDVLIVLVLAATLLELSFSRSQKPSAPQLVIATALFVGSMAWMLYPILSRAGGSEVALTLVAAGVFYLTLQLAFSSSGGKRVRGSVGLVAAAAIAPVFALDGSLLLAQVAGGLATGLGVLWLSGLLFRSESFASQWLAPMMIAALCVAANQYAEVNPWALLLVSAGVALLPLIRRWWAVESLWLDNIRLLALSALPFAAALWLIWPQESLY